MKDLARVVIRRDYERDIRMRDLYVVVDDGEEFTLRFDESTSFDVAPGEHTVRITNRLFKKAEKVAVAAGQTVTLQVANVAGGCLFAPLVVLGGTGAYRVWMQRAE